MAKKPTRRAFLQALVSHVAGCMAAACAPTMTDKPEPTHTLTHTPRPTHTPKPTHAPTNTLRPTYTPTPAEEPANTPIASKASVWLTTGDEMQKLRQQADISFIPGASANPSLRVRVDLSMTYQLIEGFGAALTDSAAWNISRLKEDTLDDLMRNLFTREGMGIGINYLRLPIGASDFTPDETVTGFPIIYSYDDNGGQSDPELAHFSIVRDDAGHYRRIAVLFEAKALNAELKVMASSWSAPSWMKDSGSPNGGRLLPGYHPAYASYLARFVQAYEAQGLPIHAITVQNEPLHESRDYPTMGMESAQQIKFVENYLGPEFSTAKIDTDILVYDHNWDQPGFALDVLGHEGASSYVAGSAWHCYAGTPDVQSLIHQAHPDKDIYFTECSGGGWDTAFARILTWNMQNLFIGAVRHWAKAVLLWNLALDEGHGPHTGGCGNCRGVVTIRQDGAVQYEVEFYIIGHLSKFVQPGAYRIASDHYPGRLETVSFRNPDNSIVLVALNPSTDPIVFDAESVLPRAQHFAYQLPARSVATFVWDSAS